MKHLWKILLVILCLSIPLAALAEEGTRVMPEPYASATFTDPSEIPYPENRDADGYLTEGEFVYENPEQGLWAYLSPTLQVEIVQYDGHWDKMDQRWFVADVRFDPAAEHFMSHNWYIEDVTGLDVLGKLQKNGVTRGDFKDQAIWPKTLAQCDRMVLAVNVDYYLYRIEHNAGNLIRQGRVLSTVKGAAAFPNLDCAAFYDDGSMRVFDATETTAAEQLEKGARDMVSFGPWLVRDGEMRHYTGTYFDHREPRLAIGWAEPGHYVIINCEGRVPNGPQGLTLSDLEALLYYNGANEAINMDGGNTSVLIFMGEKLNRTGNNTKLGSPRNQNELLGIGTSELVRTDWVNGDPKKK